MINITIFPDSNDDIVGFIGEGHALFAEKGNDIVCAMVSVLLQTALMSINVLIGIDTNNEKKEGYLKVKLPVIDNAEQKRDCTLIFSSMVVGLSKLKEKYPERIDIKFFEQV